ncbi:hypothetical protein [Novacetimonas hansenii]|uniref:hypothetical protein n=1 Tax=Novacetimonas hansenii TaxID=436 RepID=UPI000A709997|nr:hypothetical protein [Novacetimonas hansenii]
MGDSPLQDFFPAGRPAASADKSFSFTGLLKTGQTDLGNSSLWAGDLKLEQICV